MLNFIKKYDIFLFDLNNAIVNVEEFHYKAWLETLQNILGSHFIFSYDYFCEKFHPKDSESINNYLTKILKLDNYKDIMIEKNKRYIDILNKNINNIKLIDGFELLINLIIKNNKSFIIISDTYKDNVDFFIKLFPILNKATAFYYRELFNNNKFDKNTYLSIINKYTNNKLVYFTYYIIVIDTLFNYIDIIYINNNDDYFCNVVTKNYHNIINNYITNYHQLYNIYIEKKVINTLRLLSVDMINEANSGHPGTAIGCAPIIYVLWCKIMNFNPTNPTLFNRDRFILSNGHGCALLYSILFLLGYNYSIDDLKNFRQIDSITPGHPEYNPNLGIEVSTGMLGQGIANAVGMAIASKKLYLNNKIYVLCGDGCLQEGISYEACSLAGHLKLNNLILIYDNNKTTIDGHIDLTFSENIKKRFKSQNWNILEILDGDNNIKDIYNKFLIANKSDLPTIIIANTTIGYGTLKAGTSACHGSPLGYQNTIHLKKLFDFDIEQTFQVDNDVKDFFSKIIKDKINNYNDNKFKEPLLKKRKIFNKFENKEIDLYYLISKELENLNNINKDYATRDISNFCLNIIIDYIDNIIVGSADLGESTRTLIKSSHISSNDFSGKYINYGVREHAMMAIANGISTYNITPITSTFLIFSTYCLASIRMAAISKHKVIYIFTHDSVWVGEDGTTHQCISELTNLRIIPNLYVFRPYNINETIEAYLFALKNNGPTAIILSRQVIPGNSLIHSKKLNINKGGYIIYQNYNHDNSQLELIIISTGSEISLSIDIAKAFLKLLNIRVVSIPCMELFDKQNDEYKNSILPSNIKKISIEAGTTLSWYKYADYNYGINNFGKSGKEKDLREYFKFTINDIKNYILNIIK